jgi:hypothetical protein
VADDKFSGEETFHRVVVSSSSNWKRPYFLMTMEGFVVDWIGIL